MQVAIIGGGWAGMAAAVQLAQAISPRFSKPAASWVAGPAIWNCRAAPADNGQHILIGAYAECLRLMRVVGVAPEQALLRRPWPCACRWQRPELPELPAPLDALVGIASASGWSLRERAALLGRALRWRSGLSLRRCCNRCRYLQRSAKAPAR
jgi:hypothetical protein